MKKLKGLLSFVFYILSWLVLVILRGLVMVFQFIHRKKRRYIPAYLVLGYFLFVVILILISGDSYYDKVLSDKRVNDVTRLNPVQVGQVVSPESLEDIVRAVQATEGPVSIGGGRFSMGGQTAFENSLHLDMRNYNKVLDLDTKRKQVTVQSGITWRALQKVIDKHDLSVKIMQTYANFTVGGSVSVNCHGRYIGHGPIISSVLSLKLVTAGGEVLSLSRTENYDIFKAVIGGYGGIGVIAEVTLQLVDNDKVERHTQLVDAGEYVDFFNQNIRGDSAVIFQNGDLYPPHYEQINNVSWKVSAKELTDTTRVTPAGESYWLEPRLVEAVSWGDFGKWVRRKMIDPMVYSGEQVVWRNREASYDVAELEPRSREKSTYVLQEYFIPVNNIYSFIPKMKSVFEKYGVNVINVSLRHAYPDHESYLSWADEEVFAFVVYYKQETDQDAKEHVRKWTVEMTEAILSENGKWYLPYQPHATRSQFEQAFPRASQYFAVKQRLDSTHRFMNKLLEKYSPHTQQEIWSRRDEIKGYFRGEEQTILTVPEWYLVFNPKEYADWLRGGRNPSDFPYYASIDEYWKLFDRSRMLVSEAYPENDEYITMLKVIGVSVTMEYAGKMLYEKSFGRIFSWFANGNVSGPERVIMDAHQEYSNFIYHTAWYEFKFLPWISKVWTSADDSGANWLRKTERKLFFTFEFTLKALYAQFIEWAAKASYEPPVTDIYMVASFHENARLPEGLKLLAEKDTLAIAGVRRWGAFTEVVSGLDSEQMTIHEISGNDEIAVSVVTDRDMKTELERGTLLYESDMVTDPEKKRQVILLPVPELLPFLNQAQATGLTIEHIYDY